MSKRRYELEKAERELIGHRSKNAPFSSLVSDLDAKKLKALKRELIDEKEKGQNIRLGPKSLDKKRKKER